MTTNHNLLDITAIVLTYNEETHISRCIKSINEYASRVFVVDCHSIDQTRVMAEELGAIVIEHDWPGNQATQFNWALDNLSIQTEWVLRLDADEYLTPELVDELREKLPKVNFGVSAFSIPLGRAYMGKVLKHGIVNDIRIVRLFRRDAARYENRLMDEHLLILHGDTLELKNKFVDDNRLPIGQFIEKHNRYASREAALLLDAEFALSAKTENSSASFAEEVCKKREKKERYSRMPLFWRSIGYFLYRYIFRLGFLDGTEGFCWDFFQGCWYRMLVDAKVYEAKKSCGSDRKKMKEHIKSVLKVEM